VFFVLLVVIAIFATTPQEGWIIKDIRHSVEVNALPLFWHRCIEFFGCQLIAALDHFVNVMVALLVGADVFLRVVVGTSKSQRMS
jgi:hypothetical protein